MNGDPNKHEEYKSVLSSLQTIPKKQLLRFLTVNLFIRFQFITTKVQINNYSYKGSGAYSGIEP